MSYNERTLRVPDSRYSELYPSFENVLPQKNVRPKFSTTIFHNTYSSSEAVNGLKQVITFLHFFRNPWDHWLLFSHSYCNPINIPRAAGKMCDHSYSYFLLKAN